LLEAEGESVRVFIAGVDGYLGWSLALYLARRGHDVGGADTYMRRDWVAELGAQSATPIRRMTERLEAFREHFGENLKFRRGDLREYNFVVNCFKAFQPDAIVHLGEMPSAPYSMMDLQHASFTMTNNLVGTLNILYAMPECCPGAHLVKLGTMGEYGTPNIDIPEGFFTIEYRGRVDTLPFPRQAGSWYHQIKVHDSHNIMFACRVWGLRSTDIMQGVVFGTRIDEMGEDERLVNPVRFWETRRVRPPSRCWCPWSPWRSRFSTPRLRSFAGSSRGNILSRGTGIICTTACSPSACHSDRSRCSSMRPQGSWGSWRF